MTAAIMPLRTLVTVVAVGGLLAASPALARHRHRSPPAPTYPAGYWGDWQAEAIARATQRMQDAPGVTNELAPDAKATATGGPSGGVPGFSGH